MKTNQPQDALAWAARIPGTALRGEAVEHLFFRWMERDAAAAEAAALGLTDPALRGQALRSVAAGKAGGDSAAAWAWEQQLTGAGRDEAVAAAPWYQMGRLTPQESAAELANLRSTGTTGYDDHYPFPWGGKRIWPSRIGESRVRLAWEMAMAGGYQSTGERANIAGMGGWITGRGNDGMAMLTAYARMRGFFESFPWWKLEPHPELVTGRSKALPVAENWVFTLEVLR